MLESRHMYGSLKSQIHIDSAEVLELTLLQCSHMLGHYFLGISGRSHCAPLNRVLVLPSRSFYHLATGNKSIWNGSIWSWKRHHKNAFFSRKLSSLYFFFHNLPKSPWLTAINCVHVPALSLTTSILQSSHFPLLGGLSLHQLTDRWASNLHSQLKSNL